MNILDMPAIDLLGRFFLLFTNDPRVVTFVIIAGFCSKQQKDWGHALSLFLFAAVFNNVLKNYYGVPLAAFLNKQGFSYPSGHMHDAASLYGWVLLHSSSIWIKLLFSALIAGTGWALTHFGYHVFSDVIASVGFTTLTFMLCHWLARSKLIIKHPAAFNMVMLVATLLFFFLLMVQSNTPWNTVITGKKVLYAAAAFAFAWFFCTSMLPQNFSIIKTNNQITYALCVIVNFACCAAIMHFAPVSIFAKCALTGVAVPFITNVYFGIKP